MKKKYYIIVAAIALSALSFTPKKARAQDEVEYSWWYYTHRYIPWTIHGNWLPIDSTYFLGTTNNYPLNIVVDSSTRFYLDTTGINYLYGLTYIDSLVLGGHVYTDSIASATGNGMLLKVNDSSQITITDTGTVVIEKNLSVPNGYMYIDSIRSRVIHVGDSSITIGTGKGSLSSSGLNTISSSATVAPLEIISGSYSQPLTLKSGNGNITLGNSPLIPFSKFYNVNVGIGTRTPQAQLHVYDAHFNIGAPPSPVAVYTLYTSGVDSNNAHGFETGIDASGNATLNQTRDLPMHFLTNDSARMIIDSVGDVGIGDYNTFKPLSKLHINDYYTGEVFRTNSPNNDDAYWRMFADSEVFHIRYISRAVNYNQVNLGTIQNGDLNFLIHDTVRVTILATTGSTTGFVGIGEKNPTWNLVIRRDIPGLSNAVQFLNSAVTDTTINAGFVMGIEHDADAIFQQNQKGNHIRFFTAPDSTGGLVERMRIHTLGHVGIGDFSGASWPGITPARKLEVVDSTDSAQLRLTANFGTRYTDFQTTPQGNLYVQPDSNGAYKWTGLDFPIISGTANTKLALDVNGQENLRTAIRNDSLIYVLVWDSTDNGNIKKRRIPLGSGGGNISSCDSLVPGDLDFVTKWTSTDPVNPQICKSQIFDNGTNVGISGGDSTVNNEARLLVTMSRSTGSVYGIIGTSTNNTTSGNTFSIGVYGNCNASPSSESTNYGVYGTSQEHGAYNYGVYGVASSATTNNVGIEGDATGSGINNIGVEGLSSGGAPGTGGLFESTGGSGTQVGFSGLASGDSGTAFFGGYASATGTSGGNNTGFQANASGGTGINYGFYANVSGGSTTYGTYSTATASTGNVWGGRFYSYGTPNETSVGVEGGTQGNVKYAFGVRGYGESTDSNATNFGGYFVATAGGSKNNYGIYAEATGDSSWAAYINGAGYIPGGIWSPSDSKLKTQIISFGKDSAQTILNALSPKTYYYDKNTYPSMGLPDGKQFGLVAEDVEKTLPNFVRTARTPAKLDSSGNVISPSVEFKTLNYIGFIPILIAAEQSQKTKTDILQAQLAAQQAKTDSLQAQMARVNATLQQLLNCCQSQNQGSNTPGGRGGGAGEDTLSVALSNSAIILDQNAPNPFAENTTITYFIPTTVQSAQIMFYDNTGLVLKSVAITTRGEGSLLVYASNLSSGIYTYALIADGQLIASKKMVCQK